MNSVNSMSLVKAVLFATVPFAAYAAEQAVTRKTGLEGVTVWVWAFLLCFSTAGWAIVHLDTLVEWFRSDPTLTTEQKLTLWKSRLKIVQNYIASLVAGVAFYLLARSVPSWVGMNFDVPEMVIFVGVVMAAMGGTATLERIRKKFVPE